jgi:hypothetical protein
MVRDKIGRASVLSHLNRFAHFEVRGLAALH